MSNGVAIARGGQAIAAAAGSQCCCGGTGHCIPPGSSCPCSPGCSDVNASRNRWTWRLGGRVLEYSIPYTCCCGGPLEWRLDLKWQYYDRAECNGLCLRDELILSGSGTGQGTANWSRSQASSPTSCTRDLQTSGTFNVNPQCALPLNLIELAPTHPNEPPIPDAVDGFEYTDCTTAYGRIVQSASLGSTNPCAGVLTIITWSMSVQATDCNSGNQCGACCCDGLCYDGITSSACSAMGGEFKGAGSECLDVDCTQVRPSGACCKPDGTCVNTNRFQCENVMQGVYYGDGTDCSLGIFCPPPPTRACCYPNGSCAERTQFQCQQEGGTWSPTLHCIDDPCPQPGIGGCCFPGGLCETPHTAESCVNAGGTFKGIGTDCSGENPCTGACCWFHPSGTVCFDNNTPLTCAQLSPSVFQGYGTTCATTVCEGGQNRASGARRFLLDDVPKLYKRAPRRNRHQAFQRPAVPVLHVGGTRWGGLDRDGGAMHRQRQARRGPHRVVQAVVSQGKALGQRGGAVGVDAVDGACLPARGADAAAVVRAAPALWMPLRRQDAVAANQVLASIC